jgi:hypothetical protein
MQIHEIASFAAEETQVHQVNFEHKNDPLVD